MTVSPFDPTEFCASQHGALAAQARTGTRRERVFVRESVPNYNRAARMVEQMEAAGVVGPVQSNGSREVLALPPPD